MTVTSFSLIKAGPIFGVRHLQVFFLFTCCVLAYQQRTNVSVGIVAMTNANTTNPDFPEFDWDEQEKSYILSAFFWGGLLTQFPGGFLSSRYGAKMLLLYSTLTTSLISIVIPFSLSIGGWELFCVLRLLQGGSQGLMWPCFYAHLAKWCPVEERNRLGGITQTGLDIGTAIGFAASGLLAASSIGWPSMFYVPGLLGIIWSLFWLIYGANSPQESKIISMEELKMIQLSQEKNNLESGNAAATNRPMPPVPWRAIATSVPYLVLALCKMSQACSFHTLMQQIPTYIHGVFNYDIKINALLSALPFCFMCLMSYVCLITADILTRSKVASLAVVRKSINTFASWVPAVALLALGFISVKNVVGSISCLIVAVAAISAQAIGSSLNHIDLAPNYAGLIYGISDTLMSMIGVLSPIAVSLVVTDEADRTQWRTVYIAIAVALFLGNLLYIVFGKMEAQPWNDFTVETVMDTKPTNITVTQTSQLSNGKNHTLPRQTAEEQSTENFRTLP